MWSDMKDGKGFLVIGILIMETLFLSDLKLKDDVRSHYFSAISNPSELFPISEP